ncbi:MAG: phosphatase PAP2 family protein [Prevotellaceae bacterium]|jgi:undecaprenyl-diphosphatase|nr:phosphatase PAP2 family protein [Prevotellaceae bacterium]
MFTEWINGLYQLDADLLLAINGWHSSFFDSFMMVYSGKWIWVPMYAALLYTMLRNLSWKLLILGVISVALVITITDQLTATVLRPVIARLRPANLANPLSELVHIVDGYRGGAYGFPSAHAANSFGLATTVWLLFRKPWLTSFFMAWAVLTCYSRAYLGVHYPGDLLAGTIIGVAAAWVVYRLYCWATGHRPVEHPKHLYAPVLAGLLTIAGIAVYAFINARPAIFIL